MSLCAEEGSFLVPVYDAWGIIGSYAVSLIGALAAVQVLESMRTETESDQIHMHLFLFAMAIGTVTIWFMHFRAMHMLELVCPEDHSLVVQQDFDVLLTIVSWLAAVAAVYAGANIARKDAFFSSDPSIANDTLHAMLERQRQRAARRRERKQKRWSRTNTSSQASDIAGSDAESVTDIEAAPSHGPKVTPDPTVASKSASAVRRNVTMLALFGQPQKFILGGTVAALGVCVMHYVGMVALVDAQHGFIIEWNFGLVAASVVVAVVVASAGFWISFRFLRWQPEREMFRLVASIVIAAAVSSMHYTGQAAAKFRVTHSQVGTPIPAWVADKDLMQSFGNLFSAAVVVLVQMFLVVRSRERYKALTADMMDELRQLLTMSVLNAHSLEEAVANVNCTVFNKIDSKIQASRSRRSPGARSSQTSHANSVGSPRSPRAGSHFGDSSLAEAVHRVHSLATASPSNSPAPSPCMRTQQQQQQQGASRCSFDLVMDATMTQN